MCCTPHVVLYGLSRSRVNRPRQHACYVHNSRRGPNAALRSTKTDNEGQVGGSPKVFATASGRKTSLLGDYRSPTAVARVSHNTENRHRGQIKVLLQGRRGVVAREENTLVYVTLWNTNSTTNKKTHETVRRKQSPRPKKRILKDRRNTESKKYRL